MLITLDEFMDFTHKVASLLYWGKFLLFIIGIAVIIGFIAPKGKRWLIVMVTVIMSSAGYLIPDIIKIRERQTIVKKERDKAVSHYQTAEALFDEKCKTAGEKIYRTVDDVEGVTLLKMPKPYKNAYAYDPMWEDAAVVERGRWDTFSFLGVTYKNYSDGTFSVYGKPKSKKEYLNNLKKYQGIIFGYEFVDVIDENGSITRYTLPWGSKLVSTKYNGKPARYAITYDAPVIPDERKYWIAGATIKIIDTKDNSLIAEKTMFLFDYGLGSRGSDDRQPWSLAKNCPENKVFDSQIRFFVEKVLKPKQPNFNE